MSVELIGARVAEIQQQIAAFTGQATPSASFASQLAGAQSGTTATTGTAATPTTLGGGAATQYDAQITAAATKYGIDPALLKGLIRQESNFDAGAQSGAGAQGLTQLMPGTASALGVDPAIPRRPSTAAPSTSSSSSIASAATRPRRWPPTTRARAPCAKYGGVPPYAETQNYVQKVLGYAAEYRRHRHDARDGLRGSARPPPPCRRRAC